MAGEEHCPVLLDEAVTGLAVGAGGLFVDGTFGRGGHSREILRRAPDGTRLWAIDRDPSAEAEALRLAAEEPCLRFFRGNFADMRSIVESQGALGEVDGILLDLGVSSPQLDDPDRGFSFTKDGPLDMRMDPHNGESAAEWIARVDEQVLADTLYRFGEERLSRRIARRIVEARDREAITRTGQLATLIAGAIGARRERNKHPATRSFQAIRIAINGELDALSRVLDAAADMLAPGGRLSVISFHSMEDRLVKQFFRGPEPSGPRRLPVPNAAQSQRWRGGNRAIRAGEAELGANPRARSAVLRVAVKS